MGESLAIRFQQGKAMSHAVAFSMSCGRCGRPMHVGLEVMTPYELEKAFGANNQQVLQGLLFMEVRVLGRRLRSREKITFNCSLSDESVKPNPIPASIPKAPE